MFITLIHVPLYTCNVTLYVYVCDGAEPEKKNGKNTAYGTNIYLIGKKNWGQIMEGLKGFRL